MVFILPQATNLRKTQPNLSRLGSMYTKQKCWNRICLHAITLERNRPPSNAKLVLNAKWKCDVRLCGCRKSGTKWTNPKSLRNGKSSMQWVVMKPGCSENIPKWLARDCAGNKTENSVAVVLNSLSGWTLFTAKARSYPGYQDQRKERCHRVQGVFCQKSEQQDWGFALSVTFILKLIPLGRNADTASGFFKKNLFCFFVPSPEYFFGVNILPRIIIALKYNGREGRRNGKSCINPFCKWYELWQALALLPCTRGAGAQELQVRIQQKLYISHTVQAVKLRTDSQTCDRDGISTWHVALKHLPLCYDCSIMLQEQNGSAGVVGGINL